MKLVFLTVKILCRFTKYRLHKSLKVKRKYVPSTGRGHFYGKWLVTPDRFWKARIKGAKINGPEGAGK